MTTLCCGRSSAVLPASPTGAPMTNSPAAITTICGHCAHSLNKSPGLRAMASKRESGFAARAVGNWLSTAAKGDEEDCGDRSSDCASAGCNSKSVASMATIIGRQFTRTTAFPRKGFAPDLQPGTGKSRRRQLISNIRKAKSTTHVMRGIELGSRFEKPGVNDRLEGRVSPWESCFLQQGIGGTTSAAWDVIVFRHWTRQQVHRKSPLRLCRIARRDRARPSACERKT